jgi:multicomponent K+:H+ antiporter subunit D
VIPDWIGTHLAVLPVLLPASAAVLLLVLGDGGGASSPRGSEARLRVARAVALGTTAIGLAVALALASDAADGVLRVYRVGDWLPPFGIALVVDRLAALMLLLTSAVALPVLVYACGGWDAKGRHFHVLLQFQLMGLNGAFVTGDLFNLFVFFEVLLIASYALMLHGLGAPRLRAGVHYVVLNLAASALFLIGVALVYAVTGTLNLADLALRVPAVRGPEAAIVQAAGLVLLVVFGFKAAVVPLSLWLPATYAAAAAPVAALFAIMTKVGVYSIVRVHGVVYGAASGSGDTGSPALPGDPTAVATAAAVGDWLLPLAIATSVLAILGALAARTLPRLMAWLTVVSVGTVLIAFAVGGAAAWSASFYYLAQSTLVLAGLFLLSELVSAQRGAVGGHLDPAVVVAQPQLLGLLLLLGAASVAGLPPLPGFIGKLMILEASIGHAAVVAVWGTVLGVGLLTLVGLARAGSILFWNVQTEHERPTSARSSGVASGASPTLLAATFALFAASTAMSVFAQPLKTYTDAAARQLADRRGYAEAVLGGAAAAARTTRPYDGQGGVLP